MASTEPPYISMLEHIGQPEKQTQTDQTAADHDATHLQVAELFKPAEPADNTHTSS